MSEEILRRWYWLQPKELTRGGKRFVAQELTLETIGALIYLCGIMAIASEQSLLSCVVFVLIFSRFTLFTQTYRAEKTEAE